MKLKHFLSGLSLTFFITSCGRPAGEIRPQRKDITEMVFASGILEADDQYNLTAQTDGYLVKLDFREGDLVRQGQLMAVIDNSQNVISSRDAVILHDIAKTNVLPAAPALQQIAANIAAAKAKLTLDQRQADRYKRLYETNSVSKLEYENVQYTEASSLANLVALQQQYENQVVTARQQEVAQRSASDVYRVIKDQNLVKAVISGRIYQKLKQLGDYVKKGDVLAIAGDPRLIYAKLNVDESNMARLTLGQDALVRLNTDKGKIYHATLKEIFPSFDAASQSFLVKAYFSDSLNFRITGTQLEANVLVGEKKNALVIPRGYLGYGNIANIKGKGEQVIRTGIVSTDWVEVLAGVTEKDVLLINEKK